MNPLVEEDSPPAMLRSLRHSFSNWMPPHLPYTPRSQSTRPYRWDSTICLASMIEPW